MHGEGQTNSGKKEQRQINQLLNKPMTGGQGKDVEGRTTPKQHRLDGRKRGK